MKKLLNKIKGLNRQLLRFTHNNIEYFIAPLLIGIVVVGVLHFYNRSKIVYPTTPKAFADTAVMVLHKNLQHGGSGVILESNKRESIILTNKHVCRVVKTGGFVQKNGLNILVQAYKEYPEHDLCLIKVNFNFKVKTKVAEQTPDTYSPAFISGHPLLLPHVLTSGNFSGAIYINVLTGFKKCKIENKNVTDDIICAMTGKIPVIETFNSQLVTGTILPGSSGSGVFNDSGEISGLVFAGQGAGLAYAFIVPHPYITDFLETQGQYPWVKSKFNLNDSFNEDLNKVKGVCFNMKEKTKELDNICSAAYRRQIL